MKISHGFIISTLLLLISCNTVIKEAHNWIEKSSTNSSDNLIGDYFPLENGLVKTYLPEGFEPYTITQYRSILDSSLTKKQVSNEMKRLEGMRDIQGSFYLFFDPYTRSTYTINTLSYMNFSKNDAKTLLSMIKQKNNQISFSTNLNFKKLTATYTKNKDFTMFRSIFEVDHLASKIKTFSTFYIISANKQTFMINLITPFEVNFDGYIGKMKF